MNISSDLISSTISSTNPPPAIAPPRPDGETSSPVTQVVPIKQTANSLSDDDRGALLSAARDLQDSGADFEQVRSFVDSELESSGVNAQPGGERTGQMVDLFA